MRRSKAASQMRIRYRPNLAAQAVGQDDRVGGSRGAPFIEETESGPESEIAIRAARLGLEYTADAIFVTKADGTITFVNAGFEHVYGYASAEVVGSDSHFLSSWVDSATAIDQERDPAEARRPFSFVGRNRAKDGRILSIEGEVHPVLDDRGEMTSLVWVTRDVTERGAVSQMLSERDAALRSSEDHYQQLFDNNPVASWVFDRLTDRFVMVNKAAVALYGYSRDEFLSMTLNDIRSPEDGERLADAIRSPGLGPKNYGVWTHRKKDGAPLEAEITAQTLEMNGRPCMIVYARNVTEYRLLERQFRQAQKMEALGLLVGSISHDFNNLLSVITSYTSFALATVPPGEALHDDLAEVDSAAKRATEMTGQLLRLCRRQSSRPTVIDLGDAVEPMERMLKRLLGATIDLAVDVSRPLGCVCVEPGAIEQIVMNLAVNARDAMPKGGRLAIEARHVDVAEKLASQYGAEAGPYVLLSVSDTGVGMDEATQKHLFEALYTTKPAGKGTGLGLCTVAGIVKRAGGFIQVTTAPGAGAAFHIHFPRVQATDAREPATLLNRAV